MKSRGVRWGLLATTVLALITGYLVGTGTDVEMRMKKFFEQQKADGE